MLCLRGFECIFLSLVLITKLLTDSPLCWYAVKVFYNQTDSICEKLTASGVEIYRQSIVPSYIFLHCCKEQILDIREKYFSKVYLYFNSDKKEPYVIPDKEMTIFMLVTSAGTEGLMFLGEDRADYRQGDRVRVLEGPFKGAEGYVKRIKKDRKLIVSINGVAAVAIANIHSQLLEKVS